MSSAEIKGLAKDSLYYGLATIVPRFINYIMFPLYTYIFDPSQFGVISNLFAYVGIFMALLMMGLETAFFRYVGRASTQDADNVFATAFRYLLMVGVISVISVSVFTEDIAKLVDSVQNPEHVRWVIIIIFFDMLSAIPFAKLRILKEAKRFVAIKITSVSVMVALNLLFLLILPQFESLPTWLYSKDIGVGYVFIANIFGSAASLLLLANIIKVRGVRFDPRLLLKMLKYGAPIMVVGVAGLIVSVGDRILLMKFLPVDLDAAYIQGLYSANVKLAVVMSIFIQAFKYAFEPYFFKKSDDDRAAYGPILNILVSACLSILLIVTLFIDLFKYVIDPQYHEATAVVPVVMLSYLMLGIYYVLSVWYKKIDKTYWGAVISIGGALLFVLLSVILIPSIQYYGTAYAQLACYSLMVLTSYLMMRRYYPIPFQIGKIMLLFCAGGVAFFVGEFLPAPSTIIGSILRVLDLILFIVLAIVIVDRDRIVLSRLKKVLKR